MKGLNFGDETLKEEKISHQKQINEMVLSKNNFNVPDFIHNEKLNKTLNSTLNMKKTDLSQSFYSKTS